MAIMKESFLLTLEYEMTVDTETGEVLETKLVDRKVNSPKKEKKETVQKESDIDNTPKLTLEENKYILNSSAVQLMGIEPGVRLDIKYDSAVCKHVVPVIGTDEAFGTKGGNKLTKALSVAYRGNRNEELAKYGSEFIISPHPNDDKLFILTSKEMSEIKDIDNLEDIAVKVDDGDDDLQISADLDDFINTEDTEITEIDPSLFKL